MTTITELPKKLHEYPNPTKEKINLSIHQILIRHTQAVLEGPPHACKWESTSLKPNLYAQAILEGPPHAYKWEPASLKQPNLETIIKATLRVGKGSEVVSLPHSMIHQGVIFQL